MKNSYRVDAFQSANDILPTLTIYVLLYIEDILKISWYIQNTFYVCVRACIYVYMYVHIRLYAVGKAIDNSQPCVRRGRSGKCETMFVNNSRANSWQPRLCGKPEAKWSGPTTGIYPVYIVVQTPIWINILFEYDTICFARWAIETCHDALTIKIRLRLSYLVNDRYRDIYLTIEKNQIEKSIQSRYRDISFHLATSDVKSDRVRSSKCKI